MKKTLPTFVERTDPDEVTLHALNIGKTGSKKLHLFSSKKHYYSIGDTFLSSGEKFKVVNITDGSALFT